MNETPVPPAPVPPAPLPAAAPEKKGLPVVAWLGIGCGGLAILFIIGASIFVSKVKDKFDEFAQNPDKAAAELVVKMNPELKMISQDDNKGEMTIRTNNGEEITLSYNDISKGNFSIKDADGNLTQMGFTDLSKVPDWVPMPSDYSNPVGLFHSETGDKITGQFAIKSKQDPPELRTFYENAASDLNLNSSSNKSINIGDNTSVTLNFSGGNRSLNIVITGKTGSDTQVNTNYSEEK